MKRGSNIIIIIIFLYFHLVLSCIVIEQSCDVDDKRPLQPNSVSSDSNQDERNDLKSVDKHGSEIPVEDNRTKDATSTNSNSIEIIDHRHPKEKENAQMEEKPNAESENLNRRRKQKIPARVVAYAVAVDDDDIADDETQTYSVDDNIKGSGTTYEEKFSQNLSMESSSPVF